MPKRKKRAIVKKKKDDFPDEVSECESMDRPPSAKKVAAASSTSQLDDEMDQICTYSSITLPVSGGQTLLICGFCSFTAETKSELGAHARQHMTKCPHCSFSSFKRAEVSRHCKYEHDKDIDLVTSEVDSSSTECEMDKDPCIACVFCSFMTYSTEHLVNHTAHKHPGMIAKSVAKMITKQVSACVRKEDYLFYLIISNESGGTAGLGYTSASEKSSDTILIDVCVEKTEDVKLEVKDTLDTKSFQQKLQIQDPVKVHLARNTLSDVQKSGNRDTLISSSLPAPIKVETMHCLTCPYNNVYIEKMKCHTIVQHPVGAAAATYNFTGERSDAQDATFFCVREDCNHSSADCSTYQKHLMDCCSCQKTLKVLERERLRSTITFILEYHRKCKLSAVEGFFDFASPFLGFTLPPSLTGIAASLRAEVATAQAKVERTVVSPVVNIEKSPLESLPSSSYKTQSNPLASATVSSSQSLNTGSHPLCVNQSYMPQQLQDITSNVHFTGSNNVNYDSKIFNSSDSINIPVQVSSTNLPPEERVSQSDQNYSAQTFAVPFHAQNQRDLQQPSLVTQRSFQEAPQMNTTWTAPNEREPTSMVSVPAQSQQNFNMGFHNQHTGTGSRLVSHDNTHFSSPVSQSKPESLPVVQNIEVDRSFPPVSTQNNYASTFRQGSIESANTSHLNANSGHNLEIEHNAAASASNVINPMANLAFYGQQQLGNAFNTPNVEAHHQPKMLDLLSDSYSILLSDEFGPDGQIQDIGANNLVQPQQTPLCPPPYHQAPLLNTQNQAVVSQPLPLMPQGHSIVYPSMQQEESSFQQPLVDNSHISSHEIQFSFPQSSHENQLVNVTPNLVSDSGFQTVQSSSTYGAIQNTMPPGTVGSQPAPHQPVPHQPQSVPNFLVAPGAPPAVPPPAAAPGHQHAAPSFFNPRHGASQSAAGQSAPCTPPKSPNTVNRFAGASPLSPSIYLSGQSPRHMRSNWTDADMRPRGMMSASSPRHAHPSAPPPGTKSQVNQRLFTPSRRGYLRPPRMPSGRGRMPAPRFLNNQFGVVGGGGDDDDVIVTAVTRARVPPPGNQQPGGRGANRGSPGSASKGRGHPSPAHHQQRGSIPGARLPYPTTPPQQQQQQPPKQFDISKHFEDLACVVNATADEVGNDNDIEIVCVTPGDKNKSSQSKAVDASKFSFCCVHCGKDQGSKKVMKQHMKARHNDSLLGAFTNTDSGQLLFFCPQLTCEFMTYDEKRLCEHLSKCFDLDRSKPFDFGTAIKNLKSLKIRQLDVRTMGRSQDNPIDLDGQGMKDNFSSSLNDAFGDIVVNASGRHIVRNATPSHQTPPTNVRPALMPPNPGAINRAPFRNHIPGGIGPRLSHPGSAGMSNRFSRPAATIRHLRHPRHENPEMRASARQTAPPNIRMNAPNIKDFHPRAAAPVERHQSPSQRGAPLSQASTPRQPSGDRHNSVVIVIDADSPERPEEMGHNNYELLNETHIGMSNVTHSESLPGKSNQGIHQANESINSNIPQNQFSVSRNQNHKLTQPMQTSSNWNLPRDINASDSRMASHQAPALFNQPIDHSYNTVTGSISDDSEMDSDSALVQHNSVTFSDPVSCPTSSLASVRSFQEGSHAPKTANLDAITPGSNLSSDKIKLNASAYSTTSGPFSTYNEAESSEGDQRATKASSFSDIPTSVPALTSSATLPTNTVSTAEYFDEEERVNAVVLEKVFAKVPNMPKNLSRRLVAKFKEYARYRGVKISSDSKVIDEFVSKIYYKGSTADKASAKPQPVLHSSSVYPEGNSENSFVESPAASLAPANNETPENECEYVSSRELTEGRREDSMHKDVSLLKNRSEEQQPVASEDSSPQTAENDVMATQVILAQTSLQFTPTFAKIALKSLSSAKSSGFQPSTELDQPKLATRQPATEHQTANSFTPDVREFTNRRNSASAVQLTKMANPIRRCSSLPVPSAMSCSEADEPSLERLTVVLPTAASSSDSSSPNKHQDNTLPVIFSEACNPSEPEHPKHDSQIINRTESEIDFPSALESDNEPPQTPPSEEVFSTHSAFEEDDMDTPCMEEQSNKGSKTLNIEYQSTDKKSDDIGVSKEIDEETGQAGNTNEDGGLAKRTNEDTGLAKRLYEGFSLAENTNEDIDVAEKTNENKGLAKKLLEGTGLAENANEDIDLTEKTNEDTGLAENANEDIDLAEKTNEITGLIANENIGLAENSNKDTGLATKTNENGSQESPKKKKRFGLIKKLKFPEIIDKKTGKLLLMSRKITRKPFINKEVTADEIKDSIGEGNFIRRSSRSRKPVNKDYQGEINEMDDFLSDDDDEYNIDDEDDGTDTDNEWRGGNSEQQQPPKKRMKKIPAPPDPTAFDVSIKGKFKCWVCRKVFSRCSFAKSHITQKHEVGLCAIHLDKSEELKTLLLLLFCPRQCKYVTLSLEAMKSHVEACTQPLLQDGEKFVEISKQFLENTCSELQGLSLEAMLSKTKTRKPKDPTKPVKAKKPKVKDDKPANLVMKFRKSSVGGDGVNVIMSSIVPHSSSSNTATIISAGNSHIAPSGGVILPEGHSTQMRLPVSLADSDRSNQAKIHYQHNPHYTTQTQSHHLAAMASTHYTHMASNLGASSAASCSNPARQQNFTAGKQTHAGSSFQQRPPSLPHVAQTSSPMHDDDCVYVIEDNGTICLK